MAGDAPKIIVDNDWKAEAQREKERLSEKIDAAAPASAGAGPAAGDVNPNFIELVNMLAVQALAGLGMLATPSGERIPPNLESARYAIDLIEVLQQKTVNNLLPEERKLLDEILYDLRTRFMQILAAIQAQRSGGSAAPSPAKPD
ncbi:MAG: DUF1844 domain-containing protein [Phycisphaerae bacterium]